MKYAYYFLGYLNEINIISICLRLALAAICGGFLGLERGKKNRAAGFRTHILVCTGAALAMLTNLYMMDAYPGVDPSRMGAQVISGIGFLGAGTIIVTANNRIKGLTTASCLWISAVLGLCIGSGLLVISLVCFVITMAVLRLLEYYNDWLTKNNPMIILYLEIDSKTGIDDLRSYAKEKYYHINKIHRKREKPLTRNDLCISVEMDLTKNMNHEQVLMELEQLESVHYAEEI